jgi:Protein of unknown function (DUF565)
LLLTLPETVPAALKNPTACRRKDRRPLRRWFSLPGIAKKTNIFFSPFLNLLMTPFGFISEFFRDQWQTFRHHFFWSLFSLLFGVLCGSLFSLLFSLIWVPFNFNNGTLAILLLICIETINFINYAFYNYVQFKAVPMRLFNFFKIGSLLGFFIDAFKVGS